MSSSGRFLILDGFITGHWLITEIVLSEER